MKYYLALLILVCNICYGQDTAYYNEYVPGDTISYQGNTVWLDQGVEVDSIYFNGDGSTAYFKVGDSIIPVQINTVYLHPIKPPSWAELEKDSLPNPIQYSVEYVKALDSLPVYPDNTIPDNVLESLDLESIKAHLRTSDSVWFREDSAYIMFSYYQEKQEYLHVDSVYMHGNDEPIYFRHMDTVPTLIQYSNIEPQDLIGWTNEGMKYEINDYDYAVKWKKVYSVRQQEVLPECSKCWPTWKHLYYLDADKKPLPKSIIVWQTKDL